VVGDEVVTRRVPDEQGAATVRRTFEDDDTPCVRPLAGHDCIQRRKCGIATLSRDKLEAKYVVIEPHPTREIRALQGSL
jgi:hypothetical protein